MKFALQANMGRYPICLALVKDKRGTFEVIQVDFLTQQVKRSTVQAKKLDYNEEEEKENGLQIESEMSNRNKDTQSWLIPIENSGFIMVAEGTITKASLNTSDEPLMVRLLGKPFLCDYRNSKLAIFTKPSCLLVFNTALALLKDAKISNFEIVDMRIDHHLRDYLLAACSDRCLRILDLQSSEKKTLSVLRAFSLGTLGKPVAVSWHPCNEDHFVTTTDDKCIMTWSLKEALTAP
jgi:WD40 repeat protein